MRRFGSIIIAQGAIQTDFIGLPGFAGIIPAIHGLKSKCCYAALPFLRAWYNCRI